MRSVGISGTQWGSMRLTGSQWGSLGVTGANCAMYIHQFFIIMHERVKQNSSETLAPHYLSIILHAKNNEFKQKNLSPKTFSRLSAIPIRYDNGLQFLDILTGRKTLLEKFL